MAKRWCILRRCRPSPGFPVRRRQRFSWSPVWQGPASPFLVRLPGGARSFFRPNHAPDTALEGHYADERCRLGDRPPRPRHGAGRVREERVLARACCEDRLAGHSSRPPFLEARLGCTVGDRVAREAMRLLPATRGSPTATTTRHSISASNARTPLSFSTCPGGCAQDARSCAASECRMGSCPKGATIRPGDGCAMSGVWPRIWRKRRSEPEREREIISQHGQHAALHVLRSKRALRNSSTAWTPTTWKPTTVDRAPGFPSRPYSSVTASPSSPERRRS